MKKNIILIFSIFLIFFFFLYSTIFIVQNSFENLYIKKFQTNFSLFSYLIKEYMENYENFKKIKLERIKEKITYGIKKYKEPEKMLDESLINGIWFIKNDKIKGASFYPEYEDEILSFYKLNLQGKNVNTLIKIGEIPFLIYNLPLDTIEILILSQEREGLFFEMEEILNTIFSFSEILYFSILDDKGIPLLLISLYEDFLPLKGEGIHILKTPAGEIYHIEKKEFKKIFVMGYSLEPLKNFKLRTTLFLIFLILFFGILEIFIFYSILKFEKFKLKKEKEIEFLKELSAISTGFIHEIKNSLNTFSLLSKNMEEKDKEIFQEEIARIKKIINSLNLLTKYEIEKHKINLKAIIEESINFLKNEIKDSEIVVNLNEKETIYGNKDLLFVAFTNIIKNSLESDAKTLKIWSQKKGNYKIINFMDNGIRVPEDKIKKLFTPFFSTKKSMGLGLYLVKKIVEIHDGIVEFSQKKDKIFKVYLKE